jgi:putative membrane protein
MKTISHWIISAAAIGVAAYVLPGVEVTLVGALVLVVVLALINVFIKPVIFILTLPITILTIGLFSLVINGFLIWLAAQIVPGFLVSGYWSAFFFAIVLSLINMIFVPKKAE